MEIRELSKSFGGRLVLARVSLSVGAGETVAVVGPNGSGKTTLLRAVLGTDPPTSGEVLLNGRPLDERQPWVRAEVAAVLDDMGWFPDVTSAEHLDLLARGFGNRSPEDAVDAALDTLRLGRVADQVPATLSSGQRRRLALATTLVRPFSLLLLDEPEQRLDVEGRHWLTEHLRGLASCGVAILMACHDEQLRRAVGAREVQLSDDPETPHD